MTLFEPQGKKIDQEIDHQKDIINVSFIAFGQNYLNSFNAVWNNPAFTPEEIIAGWGTNAASLFYRSSQTQAFLYTVDPDMFEVGTFDLMYDVVLNTDGTATITLLD